MIQNIYIYIYADISERIENIIIMYCMSEQEKDLEHWEFKSVSQFGNVRKQQNKKKRKIAQTTQQKKHRKNYETRRENSISYIKNINK